MQRRKCTVSILVLATCLSSAVGWAVPTIFPSVPIIVGTAHPTSSDPGQPSATDYSKGLLDRAQVIKAAAEVTSQVYPNADLEQVDDYTLCEYRPDGTGILWSDNYTKVLTEKGRREEQAMSFGFVLPYNTVAVKVLELIKADGSVVPVDIAKQSKVMIDRSQMSANIYDPNSKVLQVGIPGVEIGDVVHLGFGVEPAETKPDGTVCQLVAGAERFQHV